MSPIHSIFRDYPPIVDILVLKTRQASRDMKLWQRRQCRKLFFDLGGYPSVEA